jgi:hypothetical protein
MAVQATVYYRTREGTETSRSVDYEPDPGAPSSDVLSRAAFDRIRTNAGLPEGAVIVGVKADDRYFAVGDPSTDFLRNPNAMPLQAMPGARLGGNHSGGIFSLFATLYQLVRGDIPPAPPPPSLSDYGLAEGGRALIRGQDNTEWTIVGHAHYNSEGVAVVDVNPPTFSGWAMMNTSFARFYEVPLARLQRVE